MRESGESWTRCGRKSFGSVLEWCANVCVSLGLGPAREGKTTLAEQDVVHDRKVGHFKLSNAFYNPE